MARELRYHLPGAIYHLILRGNDCQDIFYNDQDRCKLCLLIQEGVERFGHRVLAYCFMSNHIHMAIQVDAVPISHIVQNFAFRYTKYINWKYKRIGHLFQGRFKSILIDGSLYLKELVRYIHLNPVRAGIVGLPEHYQWCSHNVYLEKNKLVWVNSSYVLSAFSECTHVAIENFQHFVRSGIGIIDDVDFKKGSNKGILGDDDFIKMIKEKEEKIPEKVQISLLELVDAACDVYKIDRATLKKSGKTQHPSQVRAILALLVSESDSLTLRELAHIVERDITSLSKHATRLKVKSLNCTISEKFELHDPPARNCQAEDTRTSNVSTSRC